MKPLGTEAYRDSRYGPQVIAYYQAGENIIEERHLQSPGSNGKAFFSVRRYINVDNSSMTAFTAKLAKLSGEMRKTARGHDELMRIIRRCPSAGGLIPADEIDSPHRAVMLTTMIDWPRSMGDPLNIFADEVT